jgi:hypothetical protein
MQIVLKSKNFLASLEELNFIETLKKSYKYHLAGV